MRFEKPTKGQLEAIETNLRLYYAKKNAQPKLVRLAAERDTPLTAAWQNEAARYWYLCLRRNIDPMEMEHHVEEVIQAELDNPDWETF